jgi:ATP-dependent Clp protease adaptor protein ClpS
MSVDTDIVLDEKIRKETKEPPKYKVIFLNDDATPMEWVIEVLKTIFKHSQSSSEQITMTIHTEGAGIVGTYSYEIAEQKMTETINASRNHGFPLNVKVEEDR